jgi:hypothetical protein
LQPSGPGPKVLFNRHASPTGAQFAAYPTRLAALRRLLISQARQEQAQALRFELSAIKRKDRGHVRQAERTLRASQPQETSSDLVFSQAVSVLWNPVISPSLRSALLRLLAATPGVAVNSHATDSVGRAAVEISRYDSAANYTEAVFEAPDATNVLETSSIHPATPAKNGLPAQAAYSLSDTYLSITRSSSRPAI